MSRKRKAPKKIPVLDPKYKSVIIPKLINSIMYDGKKKLLRRKLYTTQLIKLNLNLKMNQLLFSMML